MALSGIWAHEFAEQHPTSRVIGTDLTLIQPDKSKDVPNVEFIREDIEDDWIFKEPFDFVHMRLMFSSLYSHKDVLKKIYENLKPGGWFEYQDLMFNIDSDDNSHRGTAIHKWGYLALAGGAAKGRDMEVPRKYKDYLTETGFVDVVEKRFKVYGNTWPENEIDKKIGQIGEYNGIEVVQNASPRLLQQGLGMPEAEAQELVTQTVKDIRNTDIHFYWPAYVFKSFGLSYCLITLLTKITTLAMLSTVESHLTRRFRGGTKSKISTYLISRHINTRVHSLWTTGSTILINAMSAIDFNDVKYL
jgi:SAM-dependent methyltransferase